MTAEQMRWGLEHLNLTEARIKELGAAGLFPAMKTTCLDHEGSGMVRFQQWDGKGFKPSTPYMVGRSRAGAQDGRGERREVRARRRRSPRATAARKASGAMQATPWHASPPAVPMAERGRRVSQLRRGRQQRIDDRIDHASTIRVRPRRRPRPTSSVNNIEVIYDHVILVLKGVSLQVPEGSIVALLGANGAGKSTTLKAISNLLRAERGDVTKGTIEFKRQAHRQAHAERAGDAWACAR